MRDITTEEKELLVSLKNNFKLLECSNSVYAMDSVVYADFKKLTGVDIDTLDKLYGLSNVTTKITYTKCDDGGAVIDYKVIICGTTEEKLSDYCSSAEDFLGFFTEAPAEEKTTVEDFFNDNMEEVIHKLKESYSDVVDCLKEEIISELSTDDIDDTLKEEIAMDWIHDNPSQACAEASDYMSDYDKKDSIKEMVDSL